MSASPSLGFPFGYNISDLDDQATVGAGYVSENVFDPLLATGSTAALDVSTLSPSTHSIQLIITGAPMGLTFSLLGLLNGATEYISISGPVIWTGSTWTVNGVSTPGDSGGILFTITDKLVDSVQCNLSALTGGTSPSITAIYKGSR